MHLGVATLAIALCALLSLIGKGIYNAYFHPLRKFPGPKLWSTTYLFRHFSAVRGNLDWTLLELHSKYGPCVRFSPEELSFTSEQAWKDIYGYKDIPLMKDPIRYGIVRLGKDGAPSIFNADGHNHPRIRKQLAYAFSDKALRDQEPFMNEYVDLLMEKLRGVAGACTAADLVEWFNFTTFDLIGDLAVGRSFSCLHNSQYHSWVKCIFQSIKIGPFIAAMATYTDIHRLMRILAPANVRAAKVRHEQYVEQTTRDRINQGILEERKDLLSYILKNRGEKDGLSDKEIAANCGFLLIAGSETTATALSAVTYYLLKTPEALQKITDEIRKAFSDERDINFLNAAARLPYTLACFEEALRLFPPGATGAPRKTPKGLMTSIDGEQVPGWTTVSVHALSATHSASNFLLPFEFKPERWLPSALDSESPFYHDRRGASQPFGFGPRNCLGKSLAYNEMRVILARLLWNFDLELCAESRDWDRTVTYTLWEKKPLMCRLQNIR